MVAVRVIVLTFIFLVFGQATNLGIGSLIRIRTDDSVFYKHSELISIPIGFGMASVLVTFLYFLCGISIQTIFIILMLLAVILIGICLYCGKKNLKKTLLKPVAVFIACIILLFVFAIPGLIYGDGEYVWRGNRWDKNIYATEAIAAWTHPITYYDSRDAEQILAESEVLAYGYNLLVTDRPTAPIMCALAFVSGESFLFSMYLMYMLFMAIVPGAIFFLILSIKSQKEDSHKKIYWGQAILLALLYPMCFWGQFIYDIDALSEMSSIAIFVVATVSAIRFLTGSIKETMTEYIYLIISMVAGWILYFEDAAVHSVLFGALAIFMLLLIRKKEYVIKLIKMISIPIIGVVAILITNPRLFVFLKSNGGSAFDASRQNWTYFINYWNGRYGISDSGSYFTILSKVENAFLAWNGLWFITPNYQAQMSLKLKMLWFLADAIVCMIIIGLFLYAIVSASKKMKVYIANDNNKSYVFDDVRNIISWNEINNALLTFMTAIGFTMFLAMVVMGKGWTANKMLLYISVYAFIVLLYSFLDDNWAGSIISKCPAVFALVLVCLQLWLVGIRIYNEFTNENHNGIDWNYPSDQDREVKEEYVFNYNELDIDKSRVYILDVNDRLYQLYVKMNMAFDGIQPYNYLSYDFNGIESDDFYPDFDVSGADNVYVIGTQKRTDGKEFLVIRQVEQ